MISLMRTARGPRMGRRLSRCAKERRHDHGRRGHSWSPDSGRHVDVAATNRRGRIWSIGIFRGSTPLTVSDPGGGLNPVLRAEDIDDMDAAYVADPFVVWSGGQGSMLFEIKNRATRRGEIGLAVTDGVRWSYRGSVLREPYHLSYPYVFEREGEYFLIPESLEPCAIRLYRADPFPGRWVYEADLIAGRFADPSIFRYGDRWWMFACPEPFREVLQLFHADRLEGPWHQHPRSPVISGDPRRARPSGRILAWDDRLFRFAQDCAISYGTAVRAFEITQLSERCYSEVECTTGPILAGSARAGTATACTTSTCAPGPRRRLDRVRRRLEVLAAPGGRMRP